MSIAADPNSRDEVLDACQAILGYQFIDRELLWRCLTHASIAPTRLHSNERLEFLGDAILGAVVCESLFRRYPESAEGELTRIKSVVVSRETCGRITVSLGLDRFLRLGKGVSHRASPPNSVLAAVFESVVGGIYLDGGYEAAKSFLNRVLPQEIARAAESTVGVNYKSLLQQHCQKELGETPTYKVLDEKGPDHSKCFLIAAHLGERMFTPAWGPSKKEAEQRAAGNALSTLQNHDPPFVDG